MISLSANNWRLNDISGVLFDKDGTLIDSHVYWGRIIERRSAAIIDYYDLGKDLFSDLCLSMGYCCSDRKLRPEGPIALVSREEVIDVVMAFLQSRLIVPSAEVLSELFVREHEAFLEEIFEYIHILPGVMDLLEQLKKHGVKTSVVTTDTVINTNETLRYLGIESLFAAVIGKESTKEAKATGVPAIAALKLLELNADQVVCIGDAPMDLIMAQQSELKAGIGVATGQITSTELLNHSQYVVASLQELKIHKII